MSQSRLSTCPTLTYYRESKTSSPWLCLINLMSSLLRLTNKFLFLSSHQRREFFLQRFCFCKNLHSTWSMLSLSVVKCQFALWSVLFEFVPTNDGKITQHKINGQIFTKRNSDSAVAVIIKVPAWIRFQFGCHLQTVTRVGNMIISERIDCLGELNKYA